MAFDLSFRGPFSYLSSPYPENPSFKQETETMFPLQNSIPFPPPSHNPLFHPPNTSFHQDFQDHTLNVGVANNPPHPFVMEGTPSSITNANPFFGISTPCLGESSQANGHIRDFINPHSLVTFAPNNMNALHGHQSGQVIWDFEQKVAIQTAADSSSSSQLSQPPSPISDEFISMLRARFEDQVAIPDRTDHQNTDDDGGGQRRQNYRRVQWDDDGMIAKIKGQWTPEEDKVLKELVNEHGEKKWSQIARSLHGRVGKQCRERWHNHLRPDIRKDSWTIEEDIELIKAHQEVGNKWAEIAKRMPGRSENTIKNHWNATKRRRNYRKPKKPNVSDGSLLKTYIKMLTATDIAAKHLNKFISRINVVDHSNELANMVRGDQSSDDDTDFEDCNAEELGQENEELGLSLGQHHVFTASGNGGRYPPNQFNNNAHAHANATTNGSVVNGEETGMKKEMDFMEMMSAQH